LAVRAAQLRDRRGIVRFVGLTIALGACFLGIKAIEYTLEYREHLVPGLNLIVDEFQREHPNVAPDVAGHLPLFMVFYFFMTVLHASHMLAGIGVMIYIVLAARRGKFKDNSNFVEMSGLYWHFVDIAWIFLFPLL